METHRLLVQERREKDEFFRTHSYSPLTSDQKKLFTGLSYFEPNPALALTLAAEEFADKPETTILTNTGEPRLFQKWGTVSFEVEGAPVKLLLLYSPDSGHFFLPFTDSTSGKETYGAGRYLDPQRLPDGRFVVDFNLAYSPYCAYNERWSCPLPPAENRLQVAICAGEKLPEGAWAQK